MAKPPTLAPASDWPPRQATSSRLPAQQCITQGNVHYRVAEDGTQEHLPPPRALRTQRSALSSEPETRLLAPLPHSFMGPHNCLHLSLQTFGSE